MTLAWENEAMSHRRPQWDRDDIRSARRVDLPSLLRREGLPLRDIGGGNFELLSCPGLIIKSSYWRWPQHQRQGNAIDLFVQALGKSFAEAMTIISQHQGERP